MTFKDIPKLLIYLGLMTLAVGVLSQFPRARETPELASLERVQTPLVSVQQRPSTLLRNHKGAVTDIKKGAWDILVETDGAQRWLTLGQQPLELTQALRHLAADTEVVVSHDGEAAWQLVGPAGTLISFERRAADAELARRSQFRTLVYLGLGGLGLLALGTWLSLRARAERATAPTAQA